MDSTLTIAAVAGVVGGTLLIGGRWLASALDPRPCWQKSDCTLTSNDANACAACPVFVFRDTPADAFVTRELNLPPLRNFTTETPRAA